MTLRLLGLLVFFLDEVFAATQAEDDFLTRFADRDVRRTGDHGLRLCRTVFERDQLELVGIRMAIDLQDLRGDDLVQLPHRARLDLLGL